MKIKTPETILCNAKENLLQNRTYIENNIKALKEDLKLQEQSLRDNYLKVEEIEEALNVLNN